MATLDQGWGADKALLLAAGCIRGGSGLELWAEGAAFHSFFLLDVRYSGQIDGTIGPWRHFNGGRGHPRSLTGEYRVGKRRKGREIVLQSMYASLIGGGPLLEVLDDQLSRRESADETSDFARDLGTKVKENAGAMQFGPLTSAKMEEIDRLLGR